MSKWKKQAPHLKPHIGCLNCGGGEMRKRPTCITAPMTTRIYGGFGGWAIKRDGKTVFQPLTDAEWADFPTLMTFENMARKDPDHDWRAEFVSPMRDATYQRQGRNFWVLIASGPGFA